MALSPAAAVVAKEGCQIIARLVEIVLVGIAEQQESLYPEVLVFGQVVTSPFLSRTLAKISSIAISIS